MDNTAILHIKHVNNAVLPFNHVNNTATLHIKYVNNAILPFKYANIPPACSLSHAITRHISRCNLFLSSRSSSDPQSTSASPEFSVDHPSRTWMPLALCHLMACRRSYETKCGDFSRHTSRRPSKPLICSSTLTLADTNHVLRFHNKCICWPGMASA